jgi:hypothetical protein
MTNTRFLPGLSALRGERHAALAAGLIREERLRSTAALRHALPLTSWRGRSGRRYVVGVHPSAEPDLADVTDAVVIAVERDGDGLARMVGVAAPGRRSARVSRLGWIDAVRRSGATELHVHRLADSEAERHAVLADLAGSDPAASCPA